MKDEPIKICPECEGNVKRLLYPVGIVFKGSGWYINDSRKPDTSEVEDKPAEKTDKKDAAGSDSASTTKAASGEASKSSSEPATSAAATPAAPEKSTA